MAQPGTLEVNAKDDFDITLNGDGATDVETLAEAILAKETGATDEKAKAEAEAKAKVETEAKAKEEAEAKAKAETEDKAKAAGTSTGQEKIDGVLTKDGKHVIPYAVLEADRARAKQADEARVEAERQAKELREEVERLKAGKTTDTTRASALGKELLDQIAKVSDAAPELGEVLGPIVKAVQSMEQEVANLREHDVRQERATKADAEQMVQDAIDHNPKLSFLQAKDQRLFNKVADQDAILRADPENANLTFDERFALAVKAVEAIHGEIKVPDEFLPKESVAQREAKAKADAEAKVKAEAEAKAKAGLKPEDAKARAEAELAKAKEKDKTLTLTDLPGGTSSATDDRTAVNKSANEIEEEIGKRLDKGEKLADIVSSLYTA